MNNFASGRRFETAVAKKLRKQGYDVLRLDFWERAFDLAYSDEIGAMCLVSCKKNGRLDIMDQHRLRDYQSKHPSDRIYIASEYSPNNITISEFIKVGPIQEPPRTGEENRPPN